MPLTGHCNCKAISVTINDQPSGDPHSTIYCHCMTCRRQSGGSGTFVIVADESLVEVNDSLGAQKTWKDTITDSGTPLDRQFCGVCGCPITSITSSLPGKTIVKMGLFESVPKAVIEMYTKNKEDWEPSLGVTSFKRAIGGE